MEVVALIKIFLTILLVSKTFLGFPALGEKNCYFKYLLYFRYVCNSVLPEWEIQEMFYSLVVIVEYTFISGYGELLGRLY